MKPYILGVIFARGGSKGVPQKNIRPLAGKPLIAYAIETGKAVRSIDQLIVSTDDEEVADVARVHGADIPFMRPPELAGDDTPELFAWKHAIDAVEKKLGHSVDILVSIPTTSPLRKPEDVEASIDMLFESDADIVVTVTEAHCSPYFNMVTLDDDHNAQLVMPSSHTIIRRQDVPTMYDMTTVAYVARASYIKRTSAVMEGKVKAVIIPKERALDIDTLLDFEIAEFLIKKI